jgi:hypothetical protein
VYDDKPQAWRPFEDFHKGIKTGQPVLSDGTSNLKTVEFIENVYHSAREKQRIYLRGNPVLSLHKDLLSPTSTGKNAQRV